MKTLNQINLRDSVGKVVKSTHTRYNLLLIVFKDNTFCFWKEYQDFDLTIMSDIKITYQGFIERIDITDTNKPITTPTTDLFIEAKLIDYDELIADAQSRINDLISSRRSRELCLLKTLREKYPNH